MSMLINSANAAIKREQVRDMVLAGLPPDSRDSHKVHVWVKSTGLTKVQIRNTIHIREDGGGVAD